MCRSWVNDYLVIISALTVSRFTSKADHLYSPGGVMISEEKNLCRLLMENYTDVGINGRPVVNISQPITVYFGLGLIQMDLDEKNKLLATSVWSRYSWKDEYLQWHPGEHGGIASIKLSASQVWKPDIMLYNTAETDISARDVLAVVSYDGTVMWMPHQIFKSSCSVDVTNFPFDNQTCHMHYGSWTYGLQDLDLQLAFPAGIDLSTFMADYKDSCAWDIYNSTGQCAIQGRIQEGVQRAKREALPDESPRYVVLSFTLEMRRKMVFSTYILTLPCIFLAILTLVVFWLPPDRPDRTSLAMSIFASFLVLLLILVEAAPPTASSVPTLGVYYIFNMVIIMMSIFFSTMVVNVLRDGESHQRVPKCIRIIVLNIIGRVFCIVPGLSQFFKKMNRTGQPNNSIVNNITTDEMWRLIADKPPLVNKHLNNTYDVTSTSPQDKPCSNCSSSCVFRADIRDLKSTVETIANTYHRNSAFEQNCRIVRHEWQTLAKVMDRLFFLLYMGAISFSLLVLFPRPDGFTFT